jgi:hypothetical protein
VLVIIVGLALLLLNERVGQIVDKYKSKQFKKIKNKTSIVVTYVHLRNIKSLLVEPVRVPFTVFVLV